jgi:hypothetical protein
MSLNLIVSRQKSPRPGAANSLVFFVAPVAVLLLGAMVSSPTIANEQAGAEHKTLGVTSQGAAVMPKPAIEIMRGMVDGVDEGNGTIKLRLSPETSQPLKVQDGLIFNAVRFGDQVRVLVQEIAGTKTIVGLERE